MGTIAMSVLKCNIFDSKSLIQIEKNPIGFESGSIISVQMRHGLRTNTLGRPADQKKALIRSLVTEVLTHGRVKTNMVRAKYTRKYVDKMITLSKRGDLQARRLMESFVYNKALVKSILEEAPERYRDRQGGYCRVLAIKEQRRGDNART